METQNNFYNEMDNKGKLFFKGYCSASPWCKFERVSKPESRWDVSYLYNNDILAIGEIKMRNYNSTAFNDWMIEEDKVEALKLIYTKTKANSDVTKELQIHYINIFEDDAVAIWDITHLVADYDNQLMNKNYCGNQEQKNKSVTYLPITQAIKYTRND